MRNTALLSVAVLLGGCVNMDTKNGITFIRSSSLFEPAATVVMQDGEVLSVLGGPSAAGILAGPGGQIGAAMLQRPEQTDISVETNQNQSQSQNQGRRPLAQYFYVRPQHH